MSSQPFDPAITQLLDRLYEDAARADPEAHRQARQSGASFANELEFFSAVKGAYMAVGREFGRLLYALGRGSRASHVVEFGTSFGISTIYLACAVRDNGGGKVITTEYEPTKAARARENFLAAGLSDCVEIRVGDARETLRDNLPETIDLVMLDGAKSMYREVLSMLEPRLRAGSVIASDNTDHTPLQDFLAYLRGSGSAYCSAAIQTDNGKRAHEISVRL